MKVGKVNYSKGVFRAVKQELKQEIISSVQSSKEARKEIARVFQVANRRIQNIEGKDIVSPAVLGLQKQEIEGFSKFSISRAQSWEDLKLEYAKAVSFLQQPTSTASGARQYNKYIQKNYDLSDEEFALMARKINGKLASISETSFVDKYLMRYKDFTGEIEQNANSLADIIEDSAHAIDRGIEHEAENAAEEMTDELKRILENFKNFGL